MSVIIIIITILMKITANTACICCCIQKAKAYRLVFVDCVCAKQGNLMLVHNKMVGLA